MKLSKTNKILLLFATFVICLAISFTFIGLNSARAEEPATETPATYEVSSTAFKVVDTETEHTITLVNGVKYKKSDLVIKKKVGDKTETLSFKDEFVKEDIKILDAYLYSSTYFAFDEVLAEKDFFTIGEKTFKVIVKDDTQKPSYIDIDAFVNAKSNLENELKENVLDDKAKFKDENGVDQKCYKPIGSNKYITIPSFKDFVTDDTSLYENMKYKVYYKVNGTDTTYLSPSAIGSDESKFQIPVKEPGKYTFYVAFIDAIGNEMEIADTDKEKLTLSFKIFDNYPVKVDIGANHSAKETAYLNETYKGTGSLFAYTGVSKKDFTLTYSEDNDSFKSLADAGFTEEEIKAIDFKTSDLSFKPSKKGFYKITCVAKNDTETASDTNEVVIEVVEKPAETEKEDEATTFWGWVSDHLLSVIFFCVAFVCLIAIIVLLCVKPKDETTNDSKK